MSAQPADVEQRAAEQDVLTLEVPPDASSIRTARLFASAVARHYGCDESAVEDIKLAISEACTNAVRLHSDVDLNTSVLIRARESEGSLRFEVLDAAAQPEGDHPADDMTPAGGLFEGSLGLSVVRSLFEDFEISSAPGGGTAVRFSVPIGPVAPFDV